MSAMALSGKLAMARLRRCTFSGEASQEINVFRCANEAAEDNREAADQDVPDAFRIQCFAEREEVFELRCA